MVIIIIMFLHSPGPNIVAREQEKNKMKKLVYLRVDFSLFSGAIVEITVVLVSPM